MSLPVYTYPFQYVEVETLNLKMLDRKNIPLRPLSSYKIINIPRSIKIFSPSTFFTLMIVPSFQLHNPIFLPSLLTYFHVQLPMILLTLLKHFSPSAFSLIHSIMGLLIVYCSYNRTPVIMASGRELCYVLLFGILSCYGMSFVILSRPTRWNCTNLRIGLGLCLSICYSAILTKTNRISRIFNRSSKSIKRPSYTSPRSQVAIAIGE